jgi:methylated-DNA-[protein]-cysteine S-methyltransferase
VVSNIGLCGIVFGREEDDIVGWGHSRELAPVPSVAEVDPYSRQLRQYFAGERHDFDLPIDLSTATPFAQDVLNATARIPFGRLATYRTIAEDLGKPGATRAVGNALGSNPLPIVIPCHRVIRSDGSLGGYTGGLDIKRHLLALEGALLVG